MNPKIAFSRLPAQIGAALRLAAFSLLSAAATVSAGDFGYKGTTNNTVIITNYAGPGGAVVIPTTIAGKPVAGIDNAAFYSNGILTDVTIPSGIAGIGDHAFHACTNLMSVSIPNTVTNIGIEAFAECVSLAAIAVDAANPAYSSLDGVLFDKNRATLIQYPGGKFNVSGFYTVPNSVTSIGSLAFFRCAGLTAINVDVGNLIYGSASGILFDRNKTTVVQCPAGKIGNVTIPTTVVNIGDGAFGWCSSLTSIAIPGSVDSIGDRAFENCISLDSVNIPNGVIRIGIRAFYGCASLAGITIPNSVAGIGSQAFGNCTDLAAITIPSSVTLIGSQAFEHCIDLAAITVDLGNPFYSSVDGVLFNKTRTALVRYPGHKAGDYAIPSSVTTIGNYAFESCTYLTGLSIPNGVTGIGNFAFFRCPSLTALTVDPVNPVFSSTDGVLFNKNRTALIQCPGGKVGSFTIPFIVTSIGDYAFDSCSGLTDVSIPSTVTNIGNMAFFKCSSLTNIAIPYSITGIGYLAFYRCAGLTAFTVDLANPVYSSLDGVLFDKNRTTLIQCPGGKSGLYTIPVGVTNIGDYAFDSCTDLTGISMPASVASIGLLGFTPCTGLAAISVDSGNSVYSSLDGILLNKTQTTLIQYPGAKGGTISIPSSVTSIGFWAFFRCTGLTAINVDAGNPTYSSVFGVLLNRTQTAVIQFPAGKAGSITIPAFIVSIGAHAFDACAGLTGIDVDAGNLAYSSLHGVLFDKNKIRLIQCPAGITESLAIPAGVAVIDNAAFYGCTGLSAIDVDAGNRVFSSANGVLFDENQATLFQCPAGKAGRYTAPEGVIEIADRAFSFCTSLTKIILPNSVTVIGDFAFENCDLLSGLYFRGNAPSIGVKVLNNDTNTTVFFTAGAAGWGSTFAGRPTAVWIAALPTPTIKANGATNEITVTHLDPVSVTVAMDAGDFADVPVDWWVVALAGTSWYYLNSSMQWIQYDGNLANVHPAFQGALFDLPPAEILNATGLQVGSYTFWFAIEYPTTGVLNLAGQILLDSVKVTVQ